MKNIIIFIGLVCFATLTRAQVGINTSSPSAASVLEVKSSFNGINFGAFMPPRVTIAQRNAIPVTAADDGLIAYVSGFPNGLRCLQLFNGMTMAWESINCFSIPMTNVFLETMGSVSSNTNVSVHNSNGGFSNSPGVTFNSTTSSQSQIRNSTFSNTVFPTASGSGNLYFANGNRDFIMSNIDVSTFTAPLSLQMLIYKSTTTANGSDLTIEYYNGLAWINVTTSSLPTGVATDTWHQVILAANVPNTISAIRITRATTGPEYRVDDIKIF